MNVIKANKLHKDIKVKHCPFCGESENIVLEETVKEEVSKPKRIRKQNNFENEKESE